MKKRPLIEKVSQIIFGKTYKDELDQKIINNKILWLMFLLMFIWNALLQNSYIDLKNTNHTKASFPPVNYVSGEQIIGNDYANSTHFLSWGMFDIINISSINKKTAENKINNIANKMDQENYINKKPQIDLFIKTIKDNDVKATLKIPHIIRYENVEVRDDRGWLVYKNNKKNKYGVDTFTVRATGEMKKKYGATYEDALKKCHFEVIYYRYGGELYVENFGTDCF